VSGIAADVLQKRGQFTYDDLQIGTRFQQEYAITEEVYQRFLALFGDVSPLHVSDEVAAHCGFPRKLVHGATLNGFISNFVGMHFPGKRTLELGVDIEYVKPTHIGDVVMLDATVKERLEASNVLVLRFKFLRDTTVVARGRVSIMICNVP
jgi:acyl dehydratase